MKKNSKLEKLIEKLEREGKSPEAARRMLEVKEQRKAWREKQEDDD